MDTVFIFLFFDITQSSVDKVLTTPCFWQRAVELGRKTQFCGQFWLSRLIQKLAFNGNYFKINGKGFTCF